MVGLILLALVPVYRERAFAVSPAACKDGWWADFMLGSYHIHPYKHFDEVNPGVGAECWFTSQWAASAGYFRNSLERPSFYAGALYAPRFLHWGWFRLSLMGGIISGYNYGGLRDFVWVNRAA
jgi:hypothetical protein